MNCCKMKALVSTALLILSLCCFGQGESRLALVIGNSDYSITPLQNPVNDARLMAKTLQELGFKVLVHENLETRREFANAIRVFGEMRSNFDVGFVYYAGHGMQVNAENYLLPTKESFESEYDVIDFGISAQSILRYLETSSDQVNVLILDACRNNGFEHNINPSRALNQGGGLAKISPPAGSLVAYSTEAGKTAKDGFVWRRSHWRGICRNMMKANVSLDQVFRNVRAEVMEATGNTQRPIEASLLTGNAFYLRLGEMSPRDLEDLFEEAKNEFDSVWDAAQDEDGNSEGLKIGAVKDFIEVLTAIEENTAVFWNLEKEFILKIYFWLQTLHFIVGEHISAAEDDWTTPARSFAEAHSQKMALNYCERTMQACLDWGVSSDSQDERMKQHYSMACATYLAYQLRWTPQEDWLDTSTMNRAQELISFNERAWGILDSRTATAHYLMGMCLKWNKKYKEALEHLNICLSTLFELKPNEYPDWDPLTYASSYFELWEAPQHLLSSMYEIMGVFDRNSGFAEDKQQIAIARRNLEQVYGVNSIDIYNRIVNAVDFALAATSSTEQAYNAREQITSVLDLAIGNLTRFSVVFDVSNQELIPILKQQLEWEALRLEWKNHNSMIDNLEDDPLVLESIKLDSLIYFQSCAEHTETALHGLRGQKTRNQPSKSKTTFQVNLEKAALQAFQFDNRKEVHRIILWYLNYSSPEVPGTLGGAVLTQTGFFDGHDRQLLQLFFNIGRIGAEDYTNSSIAPDITDLIHEAEPHFIQALKVAVRNERRDVRFDAKAGMLVSYFHGAFFLQNQGLLEKLPILDDQWFLFTSVFPNYMEWWY